jgi:predicted metal-dependent phosphoesterase TrpH
MNRVDLHLHTTASDGELAPWQVVELAIKNKISAIAITDHDTTDGIKGAMEYAKGRNIEVIPGIEIRCDQPETGFAEIHVLGLFLDIESNAMKNFSIEAKNERINQKKLMIKKLNSLGYGITFEEVYKEVGASFGRPHIAKILMKKYPREFSSMQEAFDKCLGVGKPAYVDRVKKVKMKQAIDTIKKAGGLAFLAHPGVYRKEDSLELIEMLIKNGGDGIETYYPYHMIVPSLKLNKSQNMEMVKFYQGIANSRKLLETGGSDFHGGKRSTINDINVPESVLMKLKEHLGKDNC